MITYFRSLPILSNDIEIEESVLQNIKNYTEEQKQAYLKDLYFMASRGFYYFDKLVLNNYSDFRYYLKAKPKNPLDVNLLSEKLILPNTFVNEDLEDLKYFEVNQIL
jgi:hypothetical protein